MRKEIKHIIRRILHNGRFLIGLLLLSMLLYQHATGNLENGDRYESEDKIVFFISPMGNDNWSGRIADIEAAQTDGPFATLEGARDAVRVLRKSTNVDVPVHIQLREGTYFIDASFILRPEDSGSEVSPTIYESYPNERATISGGRIIRNWEEDKKGLWKVKIPEVKSGSWYFRQLYVDGNRRYRPRYPKEGLFRVANLPSIDKTSWMAQSTSDEGELAKRAFKYEEGNIQAAWSNIEDVEVVISQFWRESILKIQTIDEDEQLVLFTGGSIRPLTWSFGYHIENVFEEIYDEPGTWYLDKANGVLYYHPLPGEDMTRAEVIAPKSGLNQLIKLEGDVAQAGFVQYTSFQNLTFSHTPWEIASEGYACPQAEIALQAAILSDGAHHCTVRGCDFKHIGAWCIDLRKGCRNTDIIGNIFTDIGAGAVKIGEPKVCELDIEETKETLVSDNYLRDMGKGALGAAGIWIGQSSKNVISHNDITGSLMWAVSVGWTWSYFPLQRTRDNIVEFNYIHELGAGRLGTHGAIYALGTSPGTYIRNNYIRDVYSNEHWGAGEGIILDNGCFGIIVENNIVYNAVAGGYGSNYNCAGNFIHNNIFLYGKKYQLTVYGDQPQGDQQPKGEVFSRNIVVWREGPLIKEKDWPSFNTLWDSNIYFNETGEPVTFLTGKRYTFDQWKEKGLDRHSVVADPLLVDPDNGNFSLKPGSPALKLGFKPIDISSVGPRK
ncbi:MAG: right-handed parallel beta-helix repeat-containing protein [Bacteroidales bacterium]|nr:right-handed parallel beta-helix repeat-containing protein [Bacteroidales bacterium]